MEQPSKQKRASRSRNPQQKKAHANTCRQHRARKKLRTVSTDKQIQELQAQLDQKAQQLDECATQLSTLQNEKAEFEQRYATELALLQQREAVIRDMTEALVVQESAVQARQQQIHAGREQWENQYKTIAHEFEQRVNSWKVQISNWQKNRAKEEANLRRQRKKLQQQQREINKFKVSIAVGYDGWLICNRQCKTWGESDRTKRRRVTQLLHICRALLQNVNVEELLVLALKRVRQERKKKAASTKSAVKISTEDTYRMLMQADLTDHQLKIIKRNLRAYVVRKESSMSKLISFLGHYCWPRVCQHVSSGTYGENWRGFELHIDSF